MGKYCFKIIFFAIGSVLLPSLAFAAGLGRLTVLSSLGQPLKAEIEISSVAPGEADSLTAALAPADAFRQANIEPNSSLYDIRFSIERRPNGQHVLNLVSTRPMNEPFLDMLVELNWAGGRLTREYTFLLDPPEYKGPVVAQPVPPVAPPAAEVLPAEKPAAQASAVEAPAAPAAQAGAVAAEKPAARTYEVKKGDTLGKIARENALQGVTLQQMLVALYRSNQDAFIGNNMNRLRTGPILNIPDLDAALAVAPDDARRLVSAQFADYGDYVRSIGAAVAAAPARPEGTRQSSGPITTAPIEQKPGAAKEAPRDQLRLSKPDDAKGGGKAGAAAKGDDSTAREKALKEAQERVALLEKNVSDLQKLLVLKSAPGAQVQQQAEAAKAAPATKAAPAAKAPEAPPAASKAEPAKAPPAPAAPAEPAKGAATSEPGKAPGADAAKAPAVEPGKAPDVAKAAPKAAAKAAPPPPEKGFVEELLENDYAIYGAAAVVLLLIGYGYYAWRRKKQAAEQRFGSSSVMGSAPAAPASSVLGTPGGQSVDTGTGSGQMDFSSGQPAKSDAEEIDPVAEADVYMAYGREAQAEEILKEALAKDASRVPVRLKLLEVYAAGKNAKAFEAVARELQTSTGGQGADWEKAAALGLQIDPGNALYGGSSASLAATQILPGAEAAAEAGAEPVAAPPLDFDLDAATAAPAAAQPEAPAADTPAPSALDFNLDLGADKAEAPAAAAPAAPADAGGGLDFDLGLGTEAPAAAPQAEPAKETTSPAAAGGGLDFDLNLGTDAAPAAAEEKVPELDLSAITLDIGGDTAQPAGQVDAKWQEVATKLDLAKAYEEMGDKDGARDLLNEVMKEGDPAQQQKAQTMLTALG